MIECCPFGVASFVYRNPSQQTSSGAFKTRKSCRTDWITPAIEEVNCSLTAISRPKDFPSSAGGTTNQSCSGFTSRLEVTKSKEETTIARTCVAFWAGISS